MHLSLDVATALRGRFTDSRPCPKLWRSQPQALQTPGSQRSVTHRISHQSLSIRIVSRPDVAQAWPKTGHEAQRAVSFSPKSVIGRNDRPDTPRCERGAPAL